MFGLVHAIFDFLVTRAITHSTTVRNTVADTILALINTGAASPSNGLLIFDASGSPSELAVLQFGNPAFGSAAAALATANAITACPSANGGTVATFRITNSSGQTIITGSVTATGGGGDITLNSVSLSAGQQVSMTSLTYTAMP